MKITILVVRGGQWRLLRDVSGTYMLALEEQGWWVKSTWTDSPSVRSVLVAARFAFGN